MDNPTPFWNTVFGKTLRWILIFPAVFGVTLISETLLAMFYIWVSGLATESIIAHVATTLLLRFIVPIMALGLLCYYPGTITAIVLPNKKVGASLVSGVILFWMGSGIIDIALNGSIDQILPGWASITIQMLYATLFLFGMWEGVLKNNKSF